jgi:peptidoglycan/xylan/chitin deacetylase (PgdA/CDA1 family)
MTVRFLFCILLVITQIMICKGQSAKPWNGKECAVVLTYDDAIDVDLDNVAPALDSVGLKGTFYLIGSSPSIYRRINDWRAIAANGHELGNHTSFHPCNGQLPGRGFVTPDNDLSHYTVSRMAADIRLDNALLKAIDGKSERTFAYPCGDTKIGDSSYFDAVRNEFVAARGVGAGMLPLDSVDLSNVDCYFINGQSADYMIGLVNKAMETHTLLVFLFHGVGGGHNLNVSLESHSALLHYLQQHKKQVWTATMLEVAKYIKEKAKVPPKG